MNLVGHRMPDTLRKAENKSSAASERICWYRSKYVAPTTAETKHAIEPCRRTVKGPFGMKHLLAVSATVSLAMLSLPAMFASAHDAGTHDDSLFHLASLPAPQVSITESGKWRVIRSNAIPAHPTGLFPNRANPNAISAQHTEVRVPVAPTWQGRATEARRPGIALNGVMFEPGTAECFGKARGGNAGRQGARPQRGQRPPPRQRDGQQGSRQSGRGQSGGRPQDCEWREEAIVGGRGRLGLDASNAHVQPTGQYHYHGIPDGLVAGLPPGPDGLVHVGWAADGYRMVVDPAGRLTTSYRLRTGKRGSGPGGSFDGTYTADYEFINGLSDLDSCNGTTVNGEYIYVLTERFPYVPRCLNGRPDNSFSRRR